MGLSAPTSGQLMTVTLLWSLNSLASANCRFPTYMQRNHPWVGDYKGGQLMAYVKSTQINLSETETQMLFSRECVQKVSDTKFLVMHREKNQSIKYLCMQFLQRGENIVQIKTSDMFPRQSVEICDESGMAVDPFPLVSMEQEEIAVQPICPFTGGYQMLIYQPNNSLVCDGYNMLPMRMESECDRGDGITFNFRSNSCVPAHLPLSTKLQLFCVAHWTQDGYTFIILKHQTPEKKAHWFCLRTADPLSDIKNAYLWHKVICDSSEKPRPEISQNYLRLELTKHIFSSTCEDELLGCLETDQYCNNTVTVRHCAQTCRKCMTENQVGICTFDEQYKGSWMESTNDTEQVIKVEAYSLTSGQTGRYDCLDVDSHTMSHKKVLLELYNNGCTPRYTCVDMEKITSSVMKFRFGDRLMWPLSTTQKQKEEVCKDAHFRVTERPAKLLVNMGNIREINCDLPAHLHIGIAFREDGTNCGGCLNYDPQISPNQFTISPVNCSTESSEVRDYRSVPIQYSCLARLKFFNNTVAVVTKTMNFVNGMGLYLVWIFTPENQIKVLKSGDTFLYERNNAVPTNVFQAQFSVLRNEDLQCRNLIILPRSTTTTTRHTADRPSSGRGHGKGEEAVLVTRAYTVNDRLTYNPNNGYLPEINGPTDGPRYENAKGERLSDCCSTTQCFSLYINILISSAVLFIVSLTPT